MSYDNTWTDSAQIWSDSEWMSVIKLREMLAHMDSTKIAVASSRQMAIDYFSGLEKLSPFSHDQRFPRFASFVRLDSGDWPSKIRQMLTALNFKELDQTRAGKERVEHGTRAQMKNDTKGGASNSGSDVGAADPSLVSDEPRGSIPNDVMLGFTTAISNMRLQLSRQEGIYTQRKVEDELRITWA